MTASPELQRQMLQTMQCIRRFEERASADFRAGNIHGVVHSYIGEEAIATGVCAALGVDDKIVSTHRGHGHCIAKGADLDRMMAELYGRETGYCEGKGGSMHIADFSIGMLGANGIVAGGLSIATGAGLAAQLDGGGNVACAFFGEGASNAGPFHESINIAANWKLPVVYVCENNLYAVQTPASASLAMPDVAARAAGYGIPGIVVDGNDVLAVYDAACAAVARARAGDGPSLIECKTYRWGAHTERPDQPDSRPRSEIDQWKQKDPIARLVSHLKSQQGQLSDDEWLQMDEEILARIEASVAYALASPLPDPSSALENVFAGDNGMEAADA
jgi:pyruvate dehydrogenase E1 component alpha subunit